MALPSPPSPLPLPDSSTVFHYCFFFLQMQHNPNVVACHCEGQGWRYWADCNMKIRFWGPSMQLDPLGVLSVEFEDGELYEWNKVGIVLARSVPFWLHHCALHCTVHRQGG